MADESAAENMQSMVALATICNFWTERDTPWIYNDH